LYELINNEDHGNNNCILNVGNYKLKEMFMNLTWIMIEYNKSLIDKKILIMTEIEDDYND